MKVITITTHTNILERDELFKETEYPKLNEYLEQGYTVKESIPITINSTTAYMYSITFILEKK